jgi:tetratricopeptide (TPR) repeat protein
LAIGAPALAQVSASPAAAVAQPEWRTLVNRARAASWAEFGKPTETRNYKPIYALLDEAESAAKREAGAGSEPHLTVLSQRAIYLGLEGNYDKQLRAAQQTFKLRTAGVDPSSIRYANALMLETGDLTYYHDPHRALGQKLLLQALPILKAHAPITTDELADAWYFYAQQMLTYGWERTARPAVTEDVVTFRREQQPRDIDDYIAIHRMSAEDRAAVGDWYWAEKRYKLALAAAEADPRPEKWHLGRAQLEYGVTLLSMGDPDGAEPYLTQAVASLTRPEANAWSQQILYAQGKLAEAKTASGEKRAKAAAIRQQALETASNGATQQGVMVATPGLAKMLANLKATGVSLGAAAGAAKP